MFRVIGNEEFEYLLGHTEVFPGNSAYIGYIDGLLYGHDLSNTYLQTYWYDCQSDLKTDVFQKDLSSLFNLNERLDGHRYERLREILSDRFSTYRMPRLMGSSKEFGSYSGGFGFCVDRKDFIYFFHFPELPSRCTGKFRAAFRVDCYDKYELSKDLTFGLNIDHSEIKESDLDISYLI